MQAPPPSNAIFDKELSPLNNSTIIVACCMVIMNLSAKYLPLEISPEIDQYLQSAVMRKIVVFSILYLATRKFIYAIIGTVIFFFITKFILNRNSKLNLLTSKPLVNKTEKINKEDIQIISDILSKTKNDDDIIRNLYNQKVDLLIKKLNSI